MLPSDPPPSHTCPFLGLPDDRESRFAYSHPNNTCYRLQTARPVKLETQDFYCLAPGHTGCPVYIQAIQNVDWDGFQPQRAGDKVLTPASRRKLSLLTEVLAVLAALAGLGLLAIGLVGLPGAAPSPTPQAAAQADPFEALLTRVPTATLTRRPAEPEALAALAALAATDAAATAAALPGLPSPSATAAAEAAVAEAPESKGPPGTVPARSPSETPAASPSAVSPAEAGRSPAPLSAHLHLPLLFSGGSLAAVPPVGAPSGGVTLASSPEQEGPRCGPPGRWPVYIVRRGDSLSALARATGASLAQLQAANCLDNPNRITAGQRLWVPRLPAFPPAPTQAAPTAVPTGTAQPTAAPATSTSAPPTAVPPTGTQAPPTATAPPPSATPPPPTATSPPPTATDVPPTEAPTDMPSEVPTEAAGAAA